MALTLVFVLYCLEAGLFFVVAPWTEFWALNPLLHASPIIAGIAENPFFRGFVSGLGIAHLMVGAREVLLFLRRRERES